MDQLNYLEDKLRTKMELSLAFLADTLIDILIMKHFGQLQELKIIDDLYRLLSFLWL